MNTSRSTKKIAFLAAFAVFLLLFSGCALFKHTDMARSTPEGLYQRGLDDYQEGRYKKAVESFQRVKDEHPLSEVSLLAELGIGDSYFSNEQYAEAELAYADFLSLHPANENLPYVIYQLGMCHYKQIGSIDRDQTETVRAKKEFERLVARFPSSKFSFMAEKMIQECRRMLGEKEFYIAHVYYKLKRYGAALRRFEVIAKDYAGLGLDYKVDFFLAETRKRLIEQEANKEKEGYRGISRPNDYLLF
jgi:outer membrane protein assembly factor BamD